MYMYIYICVCGPGPNGVLYNYLREETQKGNSGGSQVEESKTKGPGAAICCGLHIPGWEPPLPTIPGGPASGAEAAGLHDCASV